jgi:MFS family permease
MGLPVFWVGILLSVKRLVRIIFNPFVTNLFSRYGVRQLTIAATVVAILTTAGYGFGWGPVALCLFRIGWGLAFAILRIGTYAYAFEQTNHATALGFSRSIQELGPLLSLWLGPFFLSYAGPQHVFTWLALCSLPGFVYAWQLPAIDYRRVRLPTITLRLPTALNIQGFFLALLVDGLLIIAMGKLLLTSHPGSSPGMITAMAATYLAYRRICAVVLSPLCGGIADRFGYRPIYTTSILLIISGLLLLLTGWSTAGLLVIFTFNSIITTIAPGMVAHQVDKLAGAATNATWRDMGMAAGTVAGAFL